MLRNLTQRFRTYWADTERVQRVLFVSGTLLIFWMIAHLVLIAITPRGLDGATSFRKAATFAETGWLMSWAVAYALPYLRAKQRTKWVIVSGMLTFALGETFLVSLQTWRGVPSHYNFATVLDGVIFSVMGAMAAYWLLTMVVLAVALFRRNDLPAPMRVAFRVGSLLMIVGGVTGLMMNFNSGGVNTGTFLANVQQYFAFEFIGQYAGQPEGTVGGNIVLLHALGVHGLNVGPLVAWLLSYTALGAAAQYRWSALASVSYALLAVLLGIGVVQAVPVLGMSAVALALAAIAGVVLALSYGLALGRGLPRLLANR